MALGAQLSQLVSKVRLEVGQSFSVAAGTDETERLKAIIRRIQETLYDDHDWPYLRFFPSKVISAGQRYYDMPSGLNVNRIEAVAHIFSGKPCPLERGIDFDEYAAYNSANDERADPILKWDLRRTSATATQVEFWPVPASAGTVYFKGIRDLPALTSDTDTAALDDVMIVLFAAAEILARKKSEDAAAKLNLANARYLRMKGRGEGGAAPFVLSGGEVKRGHRGQTIIRIGS